MVQRLKGLQFLDSSMKDKSKIPQNTKDQHDEAVADEDPTQVSADDLQKMAKEAVKKFKSL